MRDSHDTAAVPRARRDQGRRVQDRDYDRLLTDYLSGQEQLREAEARFQLLVETMPGVAYIAAPTQDGEWYYLSPRLRDLLGYDPQEWLDRPAAWTSLLHPDDRERVLRDEAEWARDAQGLCVAEYRLRDASGSYRWVQDAATARPRTHDGDGVVWFGVLTDVTDARAAQQAVRESEQMLRSVLETARDAFVAIDAEGRVVEWNARAEADFGHSRADALGRTLAELIIPERFQEGHVRGVAALRRASEGATASRSVELSALRADGSEFPVELVLWGSGSGPARRHNAFVRDITDRKRMERELQRLAFEDGLTGLPNRTALRSSLDEALGAAVGTGSAVALIFLDVDDFKAINDSLGHAAGDLVLSAVAARLRQACSQGHVVARFAGDEFAVLLPHVDGVEDALAVAERIARCLRVPVEVDGRLHGLTASIGVAVGVDPSTSGVPVGAGDLLRDADAAMYDAKRQGRDRVMVFDPAMHARAVARLRMKADLDEALVRGEFFLQHQPYFVLADGRLAGFEALLRWRHPVHGLVSPLDFVPLAEETGRIRQIGAWVLQEACRDARRWAGEGVPSAGAPSVSVNVSAVQLHDEAFPDVVAQALASSGLPPDRLVLEITESVLLSGLGAVADRLRAIRSTGVRIAIDDFGTGYSSLSYLQHLPLDQLKIDRAFLADVDGEGDGAMARVVVQIARALGLAVVAEGVERPVQLEVLRALGCDYVQGYLTGRPLPVADALALALGGNTAAGTAGATAAAAG